MENRIIKFRAWSKLLKKFVDCSPPTVFLNGGKFGKHSEIEIQQYTGLKDKNGKEIFEGDVFKDEKWWVEKAKVEFYEEVFGWWSDGKEEFIPLNDCKYIEIIGNIFENPNFFK